MPRQDYQYADFKHSPLIFYYELTRACDLVCKHCRASAQSFSHPMELTTEQSKALIDQLCTFPRPPILVMTGGDPLKRPDIFDLIRYPDQFKGKYGICKYRHVCGGSRSRAFAVTGDPLESEPDCVYEPSRTPQEVMSR